MREHPLIQGPPESRIILRDFDAPINLAENYVQRLTSYLQVESHQRRRIFCTHLRSIVRFLMRCKLHFSFRKAGSIASQR